MKIFWTKEKFSKFKDKIIEKSYQLGYKKGYDQGLRAGIATIRKKFSIKRKVDKKRKQIMNNNHEKNKS